MNEKYFIIPFLAGMVYLLLILIIRGIRWISGLSKIDKLRIFQSMKTVRILKSFKEAFFEGLLHRKIFTKNPVLGYMHMSLAFGWFLLIVVGHIEAMVSEGSLSVPFYLPIFFRYFKTTHDFRMSGFFSFIMDLLLLFILSGVGLAMLKRFKKNLFGMKKTTQLKIFDRIALISLWLIFPLRLLSESITAGLYHNGSFLTSGIGNLFSRLQYIEMLNTPSWFAYSVVLGFFFVALPNSRYMHIPGEILFIFLRNAGIRLKKQNTTYTDVQVFSCSRCGICLDNCQLITAGIRDTQSVYLLKNIRNKNLDDEHLFNCLLCGKCQIDCPVGIETVDLRITQRIESTRQYNSSYDYLVLNSSPRTRVVYFAGCMTHLTPRIIASMQKIFEIAGEDYWFLDREKAPCCGRPLMHAGQYEAASKLIENNSLQILASGAKTLVVSCPICYRVFKEDYHLPNIEVLMHIEYIKRLIRKGVLHVIRSDRRLIYHDPCELGRGMDMYYQPRELLAMTGKLLAIKNEKEKAYCCGGSLGNLKIKQQERDLIRNQAVNEYLTYSPDILVTACPMCKKTFTRNTKLPVMDIAEIITRNMLQPDIPILAESREHILEEEYI